MKRLAFCTGAAALFAAAPALAHTGQGDVSGLAAGFLHPLLGLDHLLAMAAVGIWSALALSGRRVWAAPLGFVAAMVVGAGLAFAGVGLPLVEAAIAFSVLALGLMVALRLPLGAAAGAGLVAAFALFHGHAHGLEAAGGLTGYLAGFVTATALIHLGGIAVGRVLADSRLGPRLVGGAIALTGLGLVAG